MNLQALPLPYALGAISGLSERLMSSHHQNNYGGAVKRLNAIRAQLAATPFASTPGFVLNGLKREELIAANSAFLHELYFDNLGGNGVLPSCGLSIALTRDFGSVDAWRSQFIGLARAMGGGSGWALLSWSSRESRLINHWAADHTHLLAGATPVLALDMYEHAYHLDFGAKAGAYVDAFMANIHWAAVYERYQHAVHAASEGLQASIQDAQAAAQLIDVRRAGVYEAATTAIPNARWRDPAAIDTWAPELSASEDVVVYCVYGHEVGRSTALRLRAAGFNARFLQGGIDGWAASGNAVCAKAEAQRAG